MDGAVSQDRACCHVRQARTARKTGRYHARRSLKTHHLLHGKHNAPPGIPKRGVIVSHWCCSPQYLTGVVSQNHPVNNGQCPRQESNPQPTDPKSGALSIELLGRSRDYTATSVALYRTLRGTLPAEYFKYKNEVITTTSL